MFSPSDTGDPIKRNNTQFKPHFRLRRLFGELCEVDIYLSDSENSQLGWWWTFSLYREWGDSFTCTEQSVRLSDFEGL